MQVVAAMASSCCALHLLRWQGPTEDNDLTGSSTSNTVVAAKWKMHAPSFSPQQARRQIHAVIHLILCI
jgi:hypothetical protein